MTSRTFHVVPHTHWDREWYRPFEHFRLELAEVVDVVLDVLEQDTDFSSFTLDGQAIVLEDYLDVRPEHEDRLRALLAAGRLEIGPSYILPDEFLVGGEALVRNLLIGRAVCRRYGAEPSPVGYLPDSFGHPAQLPQLLAGFGIQSFIFSRGLGDELDEVGVVFRWRAPDGSEVMAFQQLPDYGNFAAVQDADEGASRVRNIVDTFGPALDRVGVRDVLLCNGSDHLPVTPQLPRLCSELDRRFPDSRFVISSYSNYVSSVGPVAVPKWTGELVGSRLQNVLRGVNSARLYIKQANECAEQRLLAVETVAALRALHDRTPFPGSDFRLAWRELLRCHPHDTICGCSCDEVHRDALARYESLHRTLSLLATRALAGLETDAHGLTVINPLPYRRTGLVEVAGAEPTLVEVDGLSAVTVSPVPVGEHTGQTDGSTIESERFRVEAAGDGTLTVTDKQRGVRLERVHGLEDELDMGDLYNFCPVQRAPMWRPTVATTRILASGPVVSELLVCVEAERPAGLDAAAPPRPRAATAPLRVTTVVRLVSGSGRIEFRTTIDNATRDHRLRVVFPAGPGPGPVRAEGQFAVLRRPLVPAPPRAQWVEPPDPTQHSSGAVALAPIAVLTKGLPEYEARTAGDRTELCLTLLRAVGLISQPDGLSTRPRTAGPQTATPEGQCLGRHECEYALLPGGDALGDVALLRESQEYRSPLVTVERSIELPGPISLEGEVVFSCLKGADDGDGVILRCFNPSRAASTARVGGELDVYACRLDEDGTGGEPLPGGAVTVAPGQIATLRLRSAARAEPVKELERQPDLE